jgi:DNA-directed RNA polymerase subunit M/transcription elongation factor TFIIS
MKNELNEIQNLIYEGLGEWAAVSETYAPEWAHPFNEAADVAQEALDGLGGFYNDIRKKLEGELIGRVIRHAKNAGGDTLEMARRKYRGKIYAVSISVKQVDSLTVAKDEMPQMACPKCGALQDDFDGLSFSYCPACGYCSHPNSTTENGKEICGVCGREIKREGDQW